MPLKSNSLYDLIALDMDGTSLDSQLEITPRTREAIRRAITAGKEVVFATGRTPSEMRRYLALFPGMRYAVCETGVAIYDVRADKLLAQQSFPPETVRRIARLLRGLDVMVTLYRDGRTLTNLAGPGGMAHFGMADYAETFAGSTTWMENLLDVVPLPGMAYSKIVLFFAKRQEREQVWQALGKLSVTAVTCTFDDIEISPQGIDKGRGLALLCERLGIPLSRVIAVGDSDNDLPLLRHAGLSAAIGNAVPAVLSMADITVSDHDHDGVAEVIERYLLP